MKTDRLLGILTVLLRQDKTTARELAEKFEVSKRTIVRDVQALCLAGFPVLTEQGAGGGISLMEGFTLDRTLLTAKELRAVLTGLKSLDSVSGDNKYRTLMQKLGASAPETLAAGEHVLIDLSSYYKQSLAPKISLLQAAMENSYRVRFSYLNRGGESERVVEPYYLIFQWSSWYLYAYCEARQGYRLFKLNRMDALTLLPERFEPRAPAPPDLSAERVFPTAIEAEVLFDASAAWRLCEEFGRKSFTVREDGRLYFRFGFADAENLFTWLLSFGAAATLCEPKSLRKEFLRFVSGILRNYEER